MLNKPLHLLYLRDPSPITQELNLENKFAVRPVVSHEELVSTLKEFTPDIVVHSLKSPVSPQELLDILGMREEDAPVIITAGNNLGKIKSLLRNFTSEDPLEDLKSRTEPAISYESCKTIFYHSPIPYWIYDQDTLQILEVNESAVKNYGYTREEFLTLSLPDLCPTEEFPLENHVADGDEKLRFGKFTHIKKDNTRIKVEAFGQGLNYNNRNSGLVGCMDITEKEKAMALFEEYQARLSAAQEIAKMGYWELNIQTQKFFLSDMVFRIWGTERSSKMTPWPYIKDAIHPDDREEYLLTQENSVREGKAHNIEYRIIQPTGEVKWIHERGRVLTWQDNKPERVERIVQDITEEKNFLEKLSTSESRYKGIVKSQTNYLIRTDMEGKYTYHNDKFLADFGWLYDGEILGQQSFSSIMEYHHEAVKNITEKCCMTPGTAIQIEIDKPRKKGKIRSTLWDFVCLVDSQGRAGEIQCVGIDISGRVKTEKQLKDSKLRYKLVTKATSDAIWDLDLTTQAMYWGNSLKTMFGYDPKDFSTINKWNGMIHPEDSSKIGTELQQAINGIGKKWYCEYRLKKSNGDYAYVLEKGTILRDKNKKAYRLVGAVQDITEKKKLQDLLENANTLSRIGSFELDLKNENLYWSQMTKEIHEVSADYVPDLKTAIQFYKKGKTRNTIQKVLREAISQNKCYDVELLITTTSGRELWVRVIGQPEVENGICLKVKGSFQDIDKIKRAEMEVLQAATEKQILLESIADAFFAIDKNYVVTYWNNHAVNLLNCPKSTILNKNLWEIFPDAVGTPFQRNYEDTMRDKKKRHFEAYFERTSSWFEVTAYPSAEGLSIFFKDVTQRKLAEVRSKELNKSLRAHTRELVTANKGLEQFSYIVSHNLRSPVANIKGLSHLLQNDDYPQNVREQLIEQVFLNVDRLDTVITDLNNILQVKIDINATKEKIDLHKLVAGIKSSIQHVIRESQAVILCDFEQTPSIVSVKSYLHSIFYNLLLNSVKYKRPGVPPVVEIGARSKGEFIFITFKDNGLGIDLSTKGDQLYNLYKRFHHHVEGKGMGLFMVKTQVEMLGGKISLESEINKGTTFTIVIKENNQPIEVEDEKAMSLSGS